MMTATDLIAAVVIAIGCFASAAVFARLAVYPVVASLLLPAAAAITYITLRTIARRSAAPHVQRPIRTIAAHVVIFIIALHILMLGNLAEMAWARVLGPRAVVVLLGVLFIAVGNLLPRVRPNLAVGLRTERLLTNPARWSRLHRAAGYATVALGCLIVAAAALLNGPAIGMAVSVGAIAAITSMGLVYRRSVDD